MNTQSSSSSSSLADPPQTPIISRKNRKRTQRTTTTITKPTSAPPLFSDNNNNHENEQQIPPQKKAKLENQQSNTTTTTNDDGDDDDEYFTLNQITSIPSLVQKFNFLIVFLHTHKRKRLGDLTVTHLRQGIKDLELSDLKIIVSCLPSAFQFYFPRQIVVPISSFHHHHAPSSLNSLNSSSFEQLCLDVKVDGLQLMSLVSQFHQLCKTEVNTRFKMIQLPQLATSTNTTTTNASQTNNNNNSTTFVTSSQVTSPSLSKMVMKNENVENVEKVVKSDENDGENGNGNKDILSKETLKRLKQNEKKRKLHSVMDRDLKRRIQYSKMLSVAQLIHTIFQMENRSRMRLNQLKTEIVNRAVNSEIANMSRADVTLVLYQLTQVPLPEEKRWCRIETLSLDHEKVFVVVNHHRGEVQDGNGGENNKSNDASGSSSSRRRSSGVGGVGGNRGVVEDEDAMLVEMMMRRSKQQDDRERRENEAFSVLKQYLEQELKKRVHVNEDGEVVETTTMTTTAMKQQEQQEKQE